MDPYARPQPSDPLVALATEVGALGRRLDRIGAELLALRAAAAAGVSDGVPPAPGNAASAGAAGWTPAAGADQGPAGLGPGWPAPAPGQPGWAHGPGGPAPSWAPAPAGVGPAGGAPVADPAAGGGAAGRPPVPAGPQTGMTSPGLEQDPAYGAGTPPARAGARRSSLSVATLLPWIGAAVTLIGVVSLIVLAVQRGWFSPEARIVAGGVLGVVLVAIGMRLHRRESARTGALALAATGFATLYLDIAGATAVVGLPDAPAVVLALLVAGAGLGLADRWQSQLLAVGVVVGAAVLAPVLVSGPLLVALVLVLQVAALPVVLRGRWPVAALVSAAAPVLYGLILATEQAWDAPRSTVLATLAVLAVGLVTAALGARRLPAGPVAALVAAAPLPVIGAVPDLGRWGGAALATGAALALLAVAALPWVERVVRTVAIAAAAVAAFQATAVAFDGSTRTALFLGQATVLAVVAAVLRRALPLAVASGYGLVGLGAAVVADAPLAALVAPVAPYLVHGVPVRSALVTGLVVSALVLAFAVAALVAAGRLGLVRPDAATAWLWVPAGLVGLYGAAGLVITAALLVTGDEIGFTAGHALVTVSWTVGALVLLARGISRQALRVTGLALIAAAVAKLVLFDLSNLDGIAQVVAFLGAGLVILAAGTRYARLVAEAEAAARAERDDLAEAAPGEGTGKA